LLFEAEALLFGEAGGGFEAALDGAGVAVMVDEIFLVLDEVGAVGGDGSGVAREQMIAELDEMIKNVSAGTAVGEQAAWAGAGGICSERLGFA
jgi:hypothetical protein